VSLPCARACQVFDLISGMGIAKSDMNGNAKAIAKFAETKPGKSLQVISPTLPPRARAGSAVARHLPGRQVAMPPVACGLL
jgi:hypothetical protein